MLESLHVKNLALIDEVEVEFTRGLNILTGETGAGKSILIGSVNLALGGKAQAGFIRENAEYALVELTFVVDNERQREELLRLDVPVEDDGRIVMMRKLSQGKSVGRINSETATVSRMKAVAGVLIDLYGQHEHQSLLYKKKHLEFLDAYCGEGLRSMKEECTKVYGRYAGVKSELSEQELSVADREREQSYLRFQEQEIGEAELKAGEDEELEQLYRRMLNGKRIVETVSEIYALTGYERTEGAGESIGRALKSLKSVVDLDEELAGLEGQLGEIDNLLNDFNRSASDYMARMNFSGQDFQETERRLNKINDLKSKYGGTLDEVQKYREECLMKLEKLKNYEEYMDGLRAELKAAGEELLKLCKKISAARKKNAKRMEEEIKKALRDLNFLDASFEIDIRSGEDKCGPGGYDEAEFFISTNPGEKLKPLADVASGGELSRIMLALKTILAGQDEIGTLIFDEIDAGISGRTAQRVSEKLSVLAGERQVICITHLPQIASMADTHFLIEKNVEKGSTHTRIEPLSYEKSVEELARLLGGVEITDKVLQNAGEMKELAAKMKI